MGRIQLLQPTPADGPSSATSAPQQSHSAAIAAGGDASAGSTHDASRAAAANPSVIHGV
jgi:hypothetical protein